MQNNGSPRSDGLTKEFYEKPWGHGYDLFVETWR